MGLSNEERLTKIYWGVHNLVETLRKLRPQKGDDLYPNEDRWEHILELGDKVWHSLLRGSRNGSYWILGGALTCPVRGPTSPWAVLIESQCGAVHQENKDQKCFGPKGRRGPDDLCLDPFKRHLGLRGLVGHSGPYKDGRRRGLLLDVYNSAEFLIYGLRRYDDALRRDFPELDKLISDILGACFDLMHKDTAFGKAYVAERMFRAVYGQWNGQLWNAFNAVYMHYALTSIMAPDVSLADVIVFDRWRIDHKNTPQNRLVLALRIAGPHLYGVRELKILIKETRGLSIREDVIRRELAKNKTAFDLRQAEKDVKQAEDSEEYRERADRDENATVHGYDFDWD